MKNLKIALSIYYSYIFLFISVVLLDIFFFGGISLKYPTTISDWGPFPVSSFTGLTNFFQVYNTKIGQVGTGNINSLTPAYLIMYIYYHISNNSAISQLSFLFIISLISAFGMMLFINYLTGKKIYGFWGGIIYAFTPIFIINQIGQGNPPGFWYYSIIPWYVFFSMKTINNSSTKNYLFLALITFFTGFLSTQTTFLIFVFFTLPIFISSLLCFKGKRFTTILYLIFTFIGIYFLLIFSYSPIISIVNSSASSLLQTGATYSYLRSLPPLNDLFFSNFPNFGNSFLNAPPYFLGTVDQSLLYVNVFIDIFLIMLSFVTRKRIAIQIFPIIFAIFIFPFILLAILESSYGIFLIEKIPYIFAIFPEYFVIPLTFSMITIISLMLKISIDYIKEGKSKKSRDLHFSDQNLKKSIYLSDEGNKWQINIKINKCLVGFIIIVLIISSVSPIVISDVHSGGYVTVAKKVTSVLYVPSDFINASRELSLLRIEYNIHSGRDLWDPVDYGATMLSAISFVDSNALIYPAEGVMEFSNSSYFKQSYSFLYYTLESLISGQKISLSNNLQQLGVAFIVVIKYYPWNTNISFPSVPFVDEGRDIIYANPLQFISILHEHKNITEVVNNSEYSIFLDNCYIGQAFSYNKVLYPLNSLEIDNLIWMDSLPIWKGSLPVLSTNLKTAYNMNNVIYLQFNNNSYSGESSGIQILSPSFLSNHSNYINYNRINDEEVNMSDVITENLVNRSISFPVFNYSGFQYHLINFSNGTYMMLDTKTTKMIENSIDKSKNFTVNLWLNASSFFNEINGIYGYTLLFGNGMSRGFNIYEISNPGYYISSVIYGVNGQNPAIYKAISTKQWYMITLVKNNTSMTMYVNGILIGTLNTSLPNFNYSPTFYIGGGPNSGFHYFNGVLSNIILINSTLNITEIERLYAYGPLNYNYTVMPKTLLFLPLNENTTELPEINLKFEKNIDQILLGYVGKINVSVGDNSISLESMNASSIVINISNSSSFYFNISGEGYGAIYYVIGIYGDNINSIIYELMPERISYYESPSSEYLIQTKNNWVFLANTFSEFLSLNVKHISLPSVNGLSFIYLYNIPSSVNIYYKGLSPNIYIILGFIFYLFFGPVFGIISNYYKKKYIMHQKRVW